MPVDKIGRDFGRLSGKDHYNVKYPVGNSFTYGQARMYGDAKGFNKYAKEGKIVVEHAVFPSAIAIEESQLIDIPHSSNYPGMDSLGYWWGRDEFDDYVVLQQILHDIVNDRCGDKLEVGKLFQVGVGDGYAAYVITKVARVNCTVEWRGFCADRWVDRMFGYGGSFRKSDVSRYCGIGFRFNPEKEDEQAALRVKLLPEYVEGFKTKYGYVPSDIEAAVAKVS